MLQGLIICILTHAHTHTQQAKGKYQHPVSLDSKLHFKRAKLFQRSSLLSTPFPLPSIVHGNLYHLHGNDSFVNVSIEYPEGSTSGSGGL